MTSEAYEKMIREDFKDHVATLSKWSDHVGPAMTLEWAQPKTNNYRIVYILRGGLLIAWGDCGEAIYSWGGVPGGLTPEWLGKLSLSYFASKCEASDDCQAGHRGMEWDREQAEAGIRAMVQEYIEAWDDNEPESEELKTITDAEFEEAAWSAESAGRFASEYEMETEDFYNIGWSISGTTRRHFYGLNMAAAQLAAREAA